MFTRLGENHRPTAEPTDPVAGPSVPPPAAEEEERYTNIGVVTGGRQTVQPLHLKPREGGKIRAQLRNAAGGDLEAQDRLRQQYMEWSREDHETMNVHVKAKREILLYAWQAIFTTNPFYIQEKDLWISRTVEKHAAYYLTYRAHNTKGKYGTYVLSRTIVEWLTNLCWAITRFTHDPSTFAPVGMNLLVGGLYVKLESTCLALTKKLQLQRVPPKQKFLTSEEVVMLMQQALDDSEKEGRFLKLQLICAMLLTFATTARPSTLAASHASFIEEGKYMRLGDISHRRVDAMTFDSIVVFNNFKGSNSTLIAKTLTFTLHAPRNVDFILLSNWCLILYQLYRGAFEFSTLEELWEYEGAVLEVIPEKREEPFFLKGLEGGRGLRELDPALAKSLSAAVANLGIKLGFGTGASLRGIRRGSGNELGMKLGAQVAANILAHSEGKLGTFWNHYSHNTANIPVLPILWGEIALSPDKAAIWARTKETQFFSSIAVLSIVKRGGLEKAFDSIGSVKTIQVPQYDEEDIAWCNEQSENGVAGEKKRDLELAFEAWQTEDWAAKPPVSSSDKYDLIMMQITDIATTQPHVRYNKRLPDALVRLYRQKLRTEELQDFTAETFTAADLPNTSAVFVGTFKNHRDQHKLIRRRRDDWLLAKLSNARPSKEIDTTAARRYAQSVIRKTAPVVQAALNTREEQPSRELDHTTDTSRLIQELDFNVVEESRFEIAITDLADRENDEAESVDIHPRSLGAIHGRKLANLLKGTAQKIQDQESVARAEETEVAEDPDTIPPLMLPENCRDDDDGLDLAHIADTPDEDGNWTGYANTDEGAPKSIFKNVSVGYATFLLMKYVAAPLDRQLDYAMKRVELQDGEKGWGCPHCDYVAKRAYHVSRHIVNEHDDWKMLYTRSRTQDPNVFQCPKCTLRFDEFNKLLAHGLSACPSRTWFREIKQAFGRNTEACTADDADLIAEQILVQHEKYPVLSKLSANEQETWKRELSEGVREGLEYEQDPLPHHADREWYMLGGSSSAAMDELQTLFKHSRATQLLSNLDMITPDADQEHGSED